MRSYPSAYFSPLSLFLSIVCTSPLLSSLTLMVTLHRGTLPVLVRLALLCITRSAWLSDPWSTHSSMWPLPPSVKERHSPPCTLVPTATALGGAAGVLVVAGGEAAGLVRLAGVAGAGVASGVGGAGGLSWWRRRLSDSRPY